ncbi:MAG: PP0621 family protein [Burkholderiales bacterium]
MKFLLLVLAGMALWWLIRGSLRGARPPRPPAAPADAPQAMLTCAQCGVHLPRDEALPGRGGVFCDAAHRDAFERTHPAP